MGKLLGAKWKTLGEDEKKVSHAVHIQFLANLTSTFPVFPLFHYFPLRPLTPICRRVSLSVSLLCCSRIQPYNTKAEADKERYAKESANYVSLFTLPFSRIPLTFLV